MVTLALHGCSGIKYAVKYYSEPTTSKKCEKGYTFYPGINPLYHSLKDRVIDRNVPVNKLLLTGSPIFDQTPIFLRLEVPIN